MEFAGHRLETDSPLLVLLGGGMDGVDLLLGEAIRLATDGCQVRWLRPCPLEAMPNCSHSLTMSSLNRIRLLYSSDKQSQWQRVINLCADCHRRPSAFATLMVEAIGEEDVAHGNSLAATLAMLLDTARMIRAARRRTSSVFPVICLIRPREGSFQRLASLYTDCLLTVQRDEENGTMRIERLSPH